MAEDQAPTSQDMEKVARAIAVFDGLAELWFVECGLDKVPMPEPFIRAIKHAHAEGLYRGRCTRIDEAVDVLKELLLVFEARPDIMRRIEPLLGLQEHRAIDRARMLVAKEAKG